MVRKYKSAHLQIIFTTIVAGLSLFAAPSQAQDTSSHRFGAGLHFGLNLDEGDPMLGADFLVDLVDLSSRVRMGLWPAYTHVFIEDWDDVEMLELDVPFQFLTNNPHVKPFAAPGLGLAFQGGETWLKLNLIGGCMFPVNDRFEPFTSLAIRLIDGTYVDLNVGMLVRF